MTWQSNKKVRKNDSRGKMDMKIMKRRMECVLKGPWSVYIQKRAPCIGREHRKKVATGNEQHRGSTEDHTLGSNAPRDARRRTKNQAQPRNRDHRT